MTRRGAVFTAAALALTLTLWGCTKSSRPHVDRVEVDAFEGKAVVGLDDPGLASRLKARLETAGFVVLKAGAKAPEGTRPWRATVAVRVEEPSPSEGARGTVDAVLSLKSADESFEVIAHEVQEAKSTDVEEIQRACVEALDFSLARVAGEARALITFLKAPEATVVAALDDRDQARRDAALRALVRRGHVAALPKLMTRLSTDDLGALRRTLGMLIELQDASSVSKIIESTRGRGPTFQREVVFAVGAIGGDEAEAYLFTVAQGHDDALIRASAERALEELRARRGRAASQGVAP